MTVITRTSDGELVSARRTLRLVVQGAVQGVGFRPFVHRLAEELGLAGWVSNTTQGVVVEVEGGFGLLQAFLARVERDKPPHSFIQSLDASFHPPAGYTTFEIRASDGGGARTAVILPDLATCAECLREVFDPGNRRYRYPFTNCTHCGPRFSIMEALPYDRPHTTMKRFAMCAECRAEYEDPRDRRFHAQPNACPRCGPHLELWAPVGQVANLRCGPGRLASFPTVLATHDKALREAAAFLRRGAIVAVKGLGGFHLLVDARSEGAVAELRRRKHREEKPFAVMCPDLAAVKGDATVSPLEEGLLCSAASPIVLLRRRTDPAGERIAGAVAPGNPYLGIMLPYTPLHHLLMTELGFPVVATSGNLSEEPICTDEREALRRLADLADAFLIHDRPIARHVDDSVVRVLAGRETVLRRARGYAPLPVSLRRPVPPVVAVGAHLKNAVAVSLGDEVLISQHIGDLETAQAFDAFERVIADLHRMREVTPSAMACDLHPDYLSTQFARKSGIPVVAVQHHYAHVLSCMAENGLEGTLLGVSWDGTGYGPDGTVWGGEFLQVTESSFTRAAHLRTFALPGGERAVHEPRRSALGLFYELFGGAVFAMGHLAPVQAFSQAELAVVRRMLERSLNTPRTSSAGRLFDALASLVGLRQESRFEGQAAMELEFALDGTVTGERYNIAVVDVPTGALVLDWGPLVRGILADLEGGTPASLIAVKCHNALVEGIVDVARRVGEGRVVLTGGCFQNVYLTERAVARLRAEGFHPYWHRLVPPNDGGIALGQVLAAARERARDE
jgi:hydrogenase maturation protein HypF